MSKWEGIRPALYSVPFTLLGALITLPWLLYTDHFREHQYGMSNQSLGEWFGEFGILTGLPKVTAWRWHLAARPSVAGAVSAEYPARLRSFLSARPSHLSALMTTAAMDARS